MKNPHSVHKSKPNDQSHHRRIVQFLFGFSALVALSSTSLMAQDNSELVVGLINRVGEVEAVNRDLNGKLEEIQHELKQLTQKMETLNADVEYRLSEAPQAKGQTPVAPTQNVSAEDSPLPLKQTSSERNKILDAPTQPAPFSGARDEPSELDLSSQDTPPASDQIQPGFGQSEPELHNLEATAAPKSPKEEYEQAREYLEQGDYATAERAFAAFVKAHPKDPNAGPAQYWYGVTYLVRGDHGNAASTFAKGYKLYPKSSKAPDMLLKLAQCLEAQGQKANVCATLDELSSKFPEAHVSKVASQRKKLKCAK